METVCLRTDHTGENIAAELQRVATAWNLQDKVVCGVTDSASNMNLALRITKWSHLPCFAHTLNLIVQGAIAADDQLSSLEAKCKHIVSYFHRSVKASDRLATVQKQLNLPTHKLIQEVETRWNSTFYMFQQYLEQHNAITTTLCLLDKKDLCLDNIELMQDAVGLLASFKSVTTEVSGEAYVSLSKVIPLVRSLQKLTISSTSKSQLRDKLIANIAYRFGTVENNHLLAASTFLDPRFKQIAFTQISAANDCEKRLLNEMGTITLHDPTDLLTVDTSSQAELQTSSLEGHCNVCSFFDEVSQCQRARTAQSDSLV